MITFYPTVSRGELGRYLQSPRVLLTASSFAADAVRKYGRVRASLPVPRLPESVVDRAADCGGFVATFKWHGVYPYTPAQYVAWLHSWRPSWAATMDFCCEPEITADKQGIVRERQAQTTKMAWLFWNTYRDCPWTWVPTIQGWEVSDYQRHAQEMAPLITEMTAHYGPESFFRVGIGTLCKRASTAMIHEVVHAVSAVLPEISLHLWGIKLGAIKSHLALPESVISMDSAAWNGLRAHGRNEWKTSGMSQRHWIHAVALPRYEEKFARALSQMKQSTMF